MLGIFIYKLPWGKGPGALGSGSKLKEFKLFNVAQKLSVPQLFFNFRHFLKN